MFSCCKRCLNPMQKQYLRAKENLEESLEICDILKKLKRLELLEEIILQSNQRHLIDILSSLSDLTVQKSQQQQYLEAPEADLQNSLQQLFSNQYYSRGQLHASNLDLRLSKLLKERLGIKDGPPSSQIHKSSTSTTFDIVNTNIKSTLDNEEEWP